SEPHMNAPGTQSRHQQATGAPSNGPGLDAEQTAVVESTSTARLVVEAGPGCGKTHVACARVAHLLRKGISPDAVLLLSFTRTAVHEIRNRIAVLSASDSAARGVEIRTIDSLAWRIATGVGKQVRVSSYEDSVSAALAALQRPGPDLREYLGRFRHVLV